MQYQHLLCFFRTGGRSDEFSFQEKEENSKEKERRKLLQNTCYFQTVLFHSLYRTRKKGKNNNNNNNKRTIFFSSSERNKETITAYDTSYWSLTSLLQRNDQHLTRGSLVGGSRKVGRKVIYIVWLCRWFFSVESCVFHAIVWSFLDLGCNLYDSLM